MTKDEVIKMLVAYAICNMDLLGCGDCPYYSREPFICENDGCWDEVKIAESVLTILGRKEE